VTWPLRRGTPCIEVQLVHRMTDVRDARTLLADTGAASIQSPFELVLGAADQHRFGGRPHRRVRLGGAIRGTFAVCTVWVEIPGLLRVQPVAAVAVPAAMLPRGLDGIAAFRFLDRFSYGNFADPGAFDLETL
jgi:hypothetical protein